MQVNHRFFGPLDNAGFDQLIDELRSGALDAEVPHHGVLCRVERNVGLLAGDDASQRGGGRRDHSSRTDRDASRPSSRFAHDRALRADRRV